MRYKCALACLRGVPEMIAQKKIVSDARLWCENVREKWVVCWNSTCTGSFSKRASILISAFQNQLWMWRLVVSLRNVYLFIKKQCNASWIIIHYSIIITPPNLSPPRTSQDTPYIAVIIFIIITVIVVVVLQHQVGALRVTIVKKVLYFLWTSQRHRRRRMPF